MEYLNTALEYYDNINYSVPDPRTKDWLLLNDSPLQVHVLSVLYLLFVLIGPQLMRGRAAFQLKKLMICYNLALVLLSIYMFVEIILSSLDLGYGLFCAVYNQNSIKNPKELRVAKVLWWYFFSKAVELCDTVLMILRKKNNQVTFLHVYHHVSMLNIWWRVMTYIPGGLSYFGSSLNCLVHVAMYTYYGLSVVPELREKLWWKKYLTRFQLIQFIITLTHTCVSLYVGCDFPHWGQWLMFYYMISMLVLFTNFYVHAYILKGRKTEKRKVESREKSSSLCDDSKSSANGSQSVTNGYKTDSSHKKYT